MVAELRTLGEMIKDGDVVAELLREASGNYDPIPPSIEEFGDIDSMMLEEATG